jgi:phage terminase large subunit-like protein
VIDNASVSAAPKVSWTRHPVIKLPTREQLAAIVQANPPDKAREIIAEIHRKREQAIASEKHDPLNYGYDPESFKKAEELLETYSELLAAGANRDGKTEWASKHVVTNLVTKPDQLWACFHSSEESSIRQQQKRIYKFLPPKWRDLGKVGSDVYVKYTKTGGFGSYKTFILPNGSQCMFFNYKQDVKVMEGYAFDGVWFDELVPIEFVDALDFRVDRDRRLETILTFTPTAGYTPTVAKFVAGAKIIETKRAHLLPQDRELVKGCPKGHMPYVMKSVRPSAAVLFFHWGMNPYGAHAEVKEKLAGAPIEKVKIRGYGWADKMVSSALSEYEAVHRISREHFDKIAKGPLTRYCVVDPAGTKNWFIKWYACTPQGWTILYREWPDAQRYGAWALPPTKAEQMDWRPGEAQRLNPPHGRGMDGYKRLILELEGGRFNEKSQKWDLSQTETIERRLIDCRMGDTQAPGKNEGTSIIDLLSEETKNEKGEIVLPRMFFEEGPDSHIQETIQMLHKAMGWDKTQPYSAINCPKWFIVDDLEQTHLCYSEFTALGTLKDALKDIIDPDRYFIKSGYGYVSPEMFRVKRKTYY